MHFLFFFLGKIISFGRTMARPYTVPLDENNISLIA